MNDDVIIEVNKTPYSLRKVLGEAGWNKYLESSKKVQQATKLVIRIQLSQMEISFARLDEKFKKLDDSSVPIE